MCHWILSSIYDFHQEWLSSELPRRVKCVIFLYQHKVSMKNCRRCESAADLVWFSSSAIKATVLQCSMLHPIVQSKRCGIKGSSRPPAPGHLHLWESTAVSAPLPTCIIQLPHTCQQNNVISPPTDSTCQIIYINHRLHSNLDGTFLPWLQILDHAKFWFMLHTEFSGVSGWSYESCNMILFDWMHQVQIGFPLTPPPFAA